MTNIALDEQFAKLNIRNIQKHSFNQKSFMQNLCNSYICTSILHFTIWNVRRLSRKFVKCLIDYVIWNIAENACLGCIKWFIVLPKKILVIVMMNNQNCSVIWDMRIHHAVRERVRKIILFSINLNHVLRKLMKTPWHLVSLKQNLMCILPLQVVISSNQYFHVLVPLVK